ncbi:MBL fold metallo-hydrolase [Carboxylicivirga sp. N1Y90]|uniref:MBL fold metallo-hydrolase n=1 Tax=Carboxylicivirga fragile TaxID=3417571 RepID=UPI003D32A984|nr:MBL fold metallo-hydrolase [Marinilabiliaceae bacterium N1Y90]
MIKVDVLPINQWQENTYILSDESKECVVIDPGCLSAEENKHVSDFIAANELKPVRLLQTHCHLDHVFGTRYIHETYNLKLEAHQGDEFFLEQMQSYAMQFGVQMEENPPAIDIYLNEGDTIKFGNSELKVIHVPGHSPGGVVFYSEADKIAIVGDALFRQSIGRTDLPGGDHEALITNLKEKILCLDDDVVVYPGHGPSSTVGFERMNNPFLT